jgi:hypothetical protein
MSDVDGEETAEPVKVFATLCVVDIGPFASVNNWQTISLNSGKASEVTPEVALSQVFDLFEVGGFHI